MKRKLLHLLLLVPVLSFAQTQRMVMVEAFSNASCGPCAAQNPAMNTLLGNNTSKAISLKHQVSWPGVDPMHSQNTADPNARVSYYGISGVPQVQVDGDTHSGSPSSVTQTLIDTRYAVAAPFSLSVTHYLSSDFDSVYITATVTAAQAYSSVGALKLHVSLAEAFIQFTTAPGTNGEKEFKHVNRKMYPSASGTTLASTWTNGQTQTFTFAEPLPNYIYDLNQVEIVSFIQDDGSTTKVVEQAAKSAAQPLALDGAITAVAGLPVVQCTNSITPTFTLKNTGATTLTSASIEVSIDGGIPTNVPWSGSLANGATATVNVPSLTTTSGSHIFEAKVVSINNNSDLNAGNNSASAPFNIFGTTVPSPVTEGFESATFPPANWVNYNPGSTDGWSRRTAVTGHAGSTAAARIFWYNIPSGEVDELFLPYMNLTGAATDTVKLSFWVAYRQYATTTNDKLEVKVSTDCGTTWATAFNKAGSTLATGAVSTSSWAPTAAADWREEVVDLSAFANQANVMIKFTATSAYGNNGFIDDINLTKNSGVVANMNDIFGNELMSQNYPNPAANMTTVEFSGVHEGMIFEVRDMLGRTVATHKLAEGQTLLNLETVSLNNGVYVYHVIENGEILSTRKLTIQK
jgi:hypothetical protein